MDSLADSVEGLLKNLAVWGGYPKYSVERRLDLFLTPFIPLYLKDKLRLRDPVELVAPELPIRHTSNYQTVNADYLMLRRDDPTWFLVELKTDATSVDDEQAEIYARVAQGPAPMRRLLDDLPEIQRHAKKRALKEKYGRLIERLDAYRAFQDAPVKVVYVAPSQPRTEPWRLVRLRAFAAWTPSEHQALWTLVAPVVGHLHDGAPARGEEVPWHGNGAGPSRVRRVHRTRDGWDWVELASPEQTGGSPEGKTVRMARDEFLGHQDRWDEEQWSRP